MRTLVAAENALQLVVPIVLFRFMEVREEKLVLS